MVDNVSINKDNTGGREELKWKAEYWEFNKILNKWDW